MRDKLNVKHKWYNFHKLISALLCYSPNRTGNMEGTSYENVYCIVLYSQRNNICSVKTATKDKLCCWGYTEYLFFAIDPDLVMVSVCACNQNTNKFRCIDKATTFNIRLNGQFLRTYSWSSSCSRVLAPLSQNTRDETMYKKLALC